MELTLTERQQVKKQKILRRTSLIISVVLSSLLIVLLLVGTIVSFATIHSFSTIFNEQTIKTNNTINIVFMAFLFLLLISILINAIILLVVAAKNVSPNCHRANNLTGITSIIFAALTFFGTIFAIFIGLPQGNTGLSLFGYLLFIFGSFGFLSVIVFSSVALSFDIKHNKLSEPKIRELKH